MKRVFVWGGFSRNYGDLAIYYSQTSMLQQQSSNRGLHFIPINSDISIDGTHTPVLTDVDVSMINQLGDMFIVGGGGMLMNRPDGLSGWQLNTTVETIRRLRVPIVVYGIGLNWFPGDKPIPSRLFESVQELFHIAKLFSVREYGTKQLLIDNGVGTQEGIEVIPDPAYFVSHDSYEVQGLDMGQSLVALCWANDRVDLRGSTDGFNDRVATDLVAYLCDKDAMAIHIPHVSAYDMELPVSLADAIGDRLLVANDIQDLYPETLFRTPIIAGLYKRADVSLSMRKHGCIIAYGMGTPFVSLGDHVANHMLASQCNMPVISTSFTQGQLLGALGIAGGKDPTAIADHTADMYKQLTAFNGQVLSLL